MEEVTAFYRERRETWRKPSSSGGAGEFFHSFSEIVNVSYGLIPAVLCGAVHL